MRERSLIQVQAGAAGLGRVILDAIEIAVAQGRWEVADRLLLAIEDLAEGSRDPASLDTAYASVAAMIGAGPNARSGR